MRRRKFISATSAVGLPLLAGCSSLASSSDDGVDYPDPPETLPESTDLDQARPGPDASTVADSIGEEGDLPDPKRPIGVGFWSTSGEQRIAVQLSDLADEEPEILLQKTYTLADDETTVVSLHRESSYALQAHVVGGDEWTAVPIYANSFDCNNTFIGLAARADGSIAGRSVSTLMNCPSTDD